MKKNLILIFTIIIFVADIYGQVRLIPLETKLENSIAVIEGEVIEQYCYYGSDKNIYTENIIKIDRILKGQLAENKISVITFGGVVNEKEQNWTNLLKLKKHDYGAFLIKRTNRPIRNDTEASIFQVYGGIQGYYNYTVQNSKLIVQSYNSKFKSIDDFYLTLGIKRSTQELRNQFKSYLFLEECLNYRFELISPNNAFGQNDLYFNVYISQPGITKSLYKTELYLSYDLNWFTDSIVTNHKIEMTLSDLFNSKYSLDIDDVDLNTIHFSLIGSVHDSADLIQINSNEIYLGQVKLSPDNLSLDFPIQENLSFQTENLYLTTENLEKEFDCLEIEFPRECDAPIVTGIRDGNNMSPVEVAGGVGEVSMTEVSGVVIITGTNFWNDDVEDINNDGVADEVVCGVLPIGHKVMFTKLIDPNNQSNDPNAENYESPWISPLPGDYSAYTDTYIEVKVPTIGLNVNGVFINGQYDVAIDGVVRVCKATPGKPCECKDDSDKIEVKFNARTSLAKNKFGCDASAQIKLPKIDHGGMEINHGNLLLYSEKVKKSFFDALITWRCATRVNFYTSPVTIGNYCNVGVSSNLDDGVLASTGIFTSTYCSDLLMTQMPGWSILLNSEILSSSKKHLETIWLHELGHAHLLQHIGNPNKTLFPSNSGEIDTSLHDDDIDGGIHISELSSSDPSYCGVMYPNMALIDEDSCEVISKSLNLEKTNFFISNPVSEYLFITNSMDRKGSNYRIQIIDINGKIKFEEMYISKYINLSHLQSGFYIFVIQDLESLQIYSQKLIKL